MLRKEIVSVCFKISIKHATFDLYRTAHRSYYAVRGQIGKICE